MEESVLRRSPVQTTSIAFPPARRRDFFDALESISFVTADERRGRRLQREGAPQQEPFYLDVDLWNPGSVQDETQVIQDFREFVQRSGGRVVRDPLRIPSLILVKVQANPEPLESLMQLDLVSLVDLPPKPLPEEAFDIFGSVQVPDPLPQEATLIWSSHDRKMLFRPLLMLGSENSGTE